MVVTSEWEAYCITARRRSRAEGDEEDITATVASMILDRGFWSSVVDVLKVASPITQLLFMTDNQSKEVMGKVYYKMFDMGQKLNLMKHDIPWAQVAAERHAERWEYLHSAMHATGYALDPEYLYTGDGDALDAATMEGLIEVVERLSLRTIIQRAVDPADAARKLGINSPQVQEHASICMTQFASFCAKEGTLTKGMVIEGAKQLPPSQWWATYCAQWPELQSVACSVLKQPVSACAAERNWSVYGQIKTHARSSMQHAVADKRVYCHETLHYQAKLQAASYKMQVATWESSDSDVSCQSDDDDEKVVARLIK